MGSPIRRNSLHQRHGRLCYLLSAHLRAYGLRLPSSQERKCEIELFGKSPPIRSTCVDVLVRMRSKLGILLLERRQLASTCRLGLWGRTTVPWVLGHCLDGHDPVGSPEGILPLFPAYGIRSRYELQLTSSRIHTIRYDLLQPLQDLPT
jgi:hypothetical protein